MNRNVFDILRERGFVKQTVFEEDLYEYLGKGSVPFYVGFDPTADSLHVGHFLVLMAMSHMQKAGHKPIVLIGGGTAMVGDPSGRTDMRSIMTKETINRNVECFKKQMSRFFTFEGPNAAIIENNADWLLNLNYIEFLREVGAQFTVNRMLSAECFKSRMEKGLSFLEFNYMLMQSYDFLVLFKKYGCRLQCGGDDQWSNILAGADLIRRKEQEPAFALTFSLLLTSEGKKMGKTMKGALWLDSKKTSPYEFFQYFRNIDDNDVRNCMMFLTYLSVDEIKNLTSCYTEKEGIRLFSQDINQAKELLAYEVTKIVHGSEEAKKAQEMSRAAFSGDGQMPRKTISSGIKNIIEIILALGLAPSRSEAKRLIQGSGIRIGEEIIESFEYCIDSQMQDNGFVIHKGKKIHFFVTIE